MFIFLDRENIGSSRKSIWILEEHKQFTPNTVDLPFCTFKINEIYMGCG